MKYGSISAKAMEGKMEDVPWKMEAACTQKDTSSAPPISFPCSNAQCCLAEEQEMGNGCAGPRALPGSQQLTLTNHTQPSPAPPCS